jgi:hypothetical protein
MKPGGLLFFKREILSRCRLRLLSLLVTEITSFMCSPEGRARQKEELAGRFQTLELTDDRDHLVHVLSRRKSSLGGRAGREEELAGRFQTLELAADRDHLVHVLFRRKSWPGDSKLSSLLLTEITSFMCSPRERARRQWMLTIGDFRGYYESTHSWLPLLS